MKAVYRTRLRASGGIQTLKVGGGDILHLHEDRQGLGLIDVWYESDAAGPESEYAVNFMVVLTGESVVPYEYEHVGTVFMQDTYFRHVYREIDDRGRTVKDSSCQ